MTPVPAIYGPVSEAATVAYREWMRALMGRADHTLDCSRCDAQMMRCPAGMHAAEVERAAWKRWFVARTVEASHGG